MINAAFHGTKDMWDKYCDEKREAVRYVIAQGQKIKRVGEIGVYAGYGAYTIMKETRATEYHGWDILRSTSPELKYAHALLKGKLDKNPWEVKLYPGADTQGLLELGVTNLDLVHIDGDHHPAACYHDMQLAKKALRSGGWMIIDDYVSDLVKDGVACWTQKYKHNIMHQHYMPGSTGNYIIQIGGI